MGSLCRRLRRCALRSNPVGSYPHPLRQKKGLPMEPFSVAERVDSNPRYPYSTTVFETARSTLRHLSAHERAP